MSFYKDLFFSISLFGFIFTLAILIRKKPIAYYFYIAVYFLFVISLFVNLIIANGMIYNLPHFYRLVSPLHFLFGPLCYFFCRTTLRPYRQFKYSDLMHFLPFLLAFIGLIPIYLLSAEEKVSLIQNGGGLIEAWNKPDSFGLTYVQLMRLKFGIFLIYLLFQWKMLVGFRQNAAAELQKANRSLFIWLSFDTMLKSLIGLVVFVSVWLINYADIGSKIQIALVCAELIASAFFLIASPDLLKGVVFNAEPSFTGRTIDEIKAGVKPEEKEFSPRYSHLGANKNSSKLNLVADLDQDIINSIEQFIQLNQPFLDPTFSLKDLAEALSINTRLVSGAIKSKLGMGFPEYINKVRFGYLENLMERDPSVLDFSVDAMAKMIGFSSRSGFYKAFKNHSNYDSPNQMIEDRIRISSKK